MSGALKEVDDVFAPILAEAKELEAFSAKRAKEIEAEIAAVDRDIVRARSAQARSSLGLLPARAASRGSRCPFLWYHPNPPVLGFCGKR